MTLKHDGVVVLDVAGGALSQEDRYVLAHPYVAGLLLFSRNFTSPEALRALVEEACTLREAPLLVAVDHEGGQVQRFHEGLDALPAMASYGALYDKVGLAPTEAKIQKEHAAAAKTLAEWGINLNLAPVLDVEEGFFGICHERSLHRDPVVVAMLARAAIKAWKQAGMMVTVKHFPGHGGVRDDSHKVLPVDHRSQDALLKNALMPFELLKDEADLVMPAHVLYTACDVHPATFSSFWLKDYLRGTMAFKGAVLSDDLSMGACRSVGPVELCAQRALDAGCDFALICNDRAGVLRTLDSLEASPPQPSAYRQAFYRKLGAQHPGQARGL